MKITQNPETGKLTVVLSKRNLLSLLHKVDQDWSAKAIDWFPPPGMEDGVHALVMAEPDDVHYADPERGGVGAGFMHPDTEDFVADPPPLEAV